MMSELRWYLLLIGAVILLWIYYTGRRQTKASKHDVFKHTEEEHSKDALLLDKDGNLLVEEEKPVKSFEDALAEVNARQVDATAAGSAPVEPESPPDRVAPADDETGIESERPEPKLPDDVDDILIESDANEPEPPAEPIIELFAEEQTVTDPEPTLQLVMMYVVAPEDKPFRGKAVLKAFHAHKLRFGEHDIFHRETSAQQGRRSIFSISNMLQPGTLIPESLQHAEVLGLGLFMQIPGPIESAAAFNEMLHTAQHLASTLDGQLRDETLQPLTEETIAGIRKQLLDLDDAASHG